MKSIAEKIPNIQTLPVVIFQAQYSRYKIGEHQVNLEKMIIAMLLYIFFPVSYFQYFCSIISINTFIINAENCDLSNSYPVKIARDARLLGESLLEP